MKISIDAKELDRLGSKIKASANLLIKEIDEAMSKSLIDLKAGHQKAITTGDTRALDTGHLRRQHFEKKKTPLIGEIEVMPKYGKYVYYGTRKMRARPWLDKGIKISKKDIQKNFNTAIKNIVRKLK